jgi:uncharacterized OB-fold protein
MPSAAAYVCDEDNYVGLEDIFDATPSVCGLAAMAWAFPGNWHRTCKWLSGQQDSEITMEDPARLPVPIANADSAHYWRAARERRLVIRQCTACGTRHFMPRYQCPLCWSDKLEWIDSTGIGSVYSYTIIRRAPMSTFAASAPYVVSLIELDDGPRMIANVVGSGALQLQIGDRVSVIFEDRGDGAMLPQFHLVAVKG